jgi:hypothetical protein
MRCVRAIPTIHYDGITDGIMMRSRLEDKWARHIKSFGGIKCEYEIERFILPSGKYLPDFFLTIKPRWDDENQGKIDYLWIEIKGREPTELQLTKLIELSAHTKHICLLLWGKPEWFKCFYTYPDGKHGWMEKYSNHGFFYQFIFLMEGFLTDLEYPITHYTPKANFNSEKRLKI